MIASRRLRWRPTAHARRVFTLSVLAVLLGFALGRPAVVALAAVPVALACRSAARRPAGCELEVVAAGTTSFENEPIQITIKASSHDPVELVGISVRPARHVRWVTSDAAVAPGNEPTTMGGTVEVSRWGRRPLGTATVNLVTGGGLWHARTTVRLGELAVYPQPAPVKRLPIAPLRGGLSGDHRGRRAGAGGEFFGIRPYGPGDSPRSVNWPTSLRLQQLHVTERRAEEAVDVVLVIDTLGDAGPPGGSSLDLSVRGACGVAQFLLRSHDRVGVVALGGWLRWLRPETGERQFYRIVATMMDVLGRESYIDPDLDKIPPRSVPSGAQVVLFSPLLDARALVGIQQLRARGLQVTVVDVLTAEPVPANGEDRLALRLWRLEREATEYALAGLGVPVVAWDGQAGLEVRLAPMLSRRRRGAMR
jgi:uncharacterized protein (DUF58 family)